MPEYRCLVCRRELEHGLYQDANVPLCNTQCATWFARAVLNRELLSGRGYARIEDWLSQYTEVIRKRAVRAKGKSDA